MAASLSYECWSAKSRFCAAPSSAPGKTLSLSPPGLRGCAASPGVEMGVQALAAAMGRGGGTARVRGSLKETVSGRASASSRLRVKRSARAAMIWRTTDSGAEAPGGQAQGAHAVEPGPVQLGLGNPGRVTDAKGLFFCGSCAGPKDIEECVMDGTIAAAKASVYLEGLK